MGVSVQLSENRRGSTMVDCTLAEDSSDIIRSARARPKAGRVAWSIGHYRQLISEVRK